MVSSQLISYINDMSYFWKILVRFLYTPQHWDSPQQGHKWRPLSCWWWGLLYFGPTGPRLCFQYSWPFYTVKITVFYVVLPAMFYSLYLFIQFILVFFYPFHLCGFTLYKHVVYLIWNVLYKVLINNFNYVFYFHYTTESTVTLQNNQVYLHLCSWCNALPDRDRCDTH